MGLKPIYIKKSSFCISAQSNLENEFLNPIKLPICRQFNIGETDYSDLIPSSQLRRLSRILKASMYAALKCMHQSGIEKVDGIILGTARGSLFDTEKFLKDIIKFKEESLNPTPFIFSTYNAIIGAIALKTQSIGYNQTFVHGGNSLELSFYDAQLQMHIENKTQNFLVGSYDEISEDYIKIKDKLGYWKNDFKENKSLLLQNDSEGTIGGEGTSFFICSNNPENSILKICKISTHNLLTTQDLITNLHLHLKEISWNANEIDLLIFGLNGNASDQESYSAIINNLPIEVPILAFKHLCGDFETAGGFGIHLLNCLLKKMDLPDCIWYKKPKRKLSFKRILYFNHFRNKQQSFIFLSKTIV